MRHGDGVGQRGAAAGMCPIPGVPRWNPSYVAEERGCILCAPKHTHTDAGRGQDVALNSSVRFRLLPTTVGLGKERRKLGVLGRAGPGTRLANELW